jgi:hypothetical protein
MPRRTSRRDVHYVTFIFADGAAVTCTPTRKPSKKKIKNERIHIDADHVVREFRYSPKEFDHASDEVRVRMSDLLANRLNMRRTVRELVLPPLTSIQSSLHALEARIGRIEQARSKSHGSS